MAEATATTTATPKSKLSRATRKKLGRDKRRVKLKTDKEYAKGFFAARSKRSVDKKAAFRKKKKSKK